VRAGAQDGGGVHAWIVRCIWFVILYVFCLIIILKFSYFYYIWRLKIHDLLEIWGNKCLTL
jgi:hypothetical protein